MRRETKTWAGRLAAAAVVVFVLAYVPYHVYVRSGLAHTLVLRRDLTALHAHNQELAAENRAARPRGRGAARRSGRHRTRRARRARLGPRGRDRRRPVGQRRRRRCGHAAMKTAKSKTKNRALGERIGYHAGRVTRASLAFVVCGVVLVLLWLGWFPDLRAARRRPATRRRRHAADGPARVQDRRARAHRRAPPHAAPRGGLRRGAGPAAADDRLPPARVLGRRRRRRSTRWSTRWSASW